MLNHGSLMGISKEMTSNILLHEIIITYDIPDILQCVESFRSPGIGAYYPSQMWYKS